MKVLLESIESIERGVEYATKVDLPEVWSQLAKAQLAVDVGAAVTSYIKARGDSPTDSLSAPLLSLIAPLSSLSPLSPLSPLSSLSSLSPLPSLLSPLSCILITLSSLLSSLFSPTSSLSSVNNVHHVIHHVSHPQSKSHPVTASGS